MSWLLQQLTAGALWYPKGLRHTVEIYAGLIAGCISAACAFWWMKRGTRARVTQRWTAFTSNAPAVAAVCLTMGCVIFAYSFSMRSQSIHTLFVDDAWWVFHFGKKPYKNIEEARKDIAGPVKRGDVAEQLEHVPDFVDVRRNTLFFPVVFTAEHQSQLIAAGREQIPGATDKVALDKGLRHMLDNEPMRIIDWGIEPEEMRIRNAYVNRFLFAHLMIIIMFAAAWGIYPQKEDAILELIAPNNSD